MSLYLSYHVYALLCPFLFVNCPTVICSPNMLLSYGRDTSSELWTPVLFFPSHTIYCNTCFTVFLQTIIFHTIRLILCYNKPVRLTTSLFRWGKVLWLCCAGSTLAPESLVLRRITFRHHQPSTCFLAPPGSIKLGFFLRENLLLCASYLPLGVPNERVSYTPSPMHCHLYTRGTRSLRRSHK